MSYVLQGMVVMDRIPICCYAVPVVAVPMTDAGNNGCRPARFWRIEQVISRLGFEFWKLSQSPHFCPGSPRKRISLVAGRAWSDQCGMYCKQVSVPDPLPVAIVAGQKGGSQARE